MIPNDRSFTIDRVVQLALFAGLAWCLVLLLDYLSDVLLPFVTGLVMAYFLDPVTNRVQHVIKKRVLAALFTLVTITLAVFLVIWFMVPMVGNELANMGRTVSKMAADTELAQAAKERLPENVWEEVNEILKRDDVKRYLNSDGVVQMAKDTAKKLLPGVWGVLSGAANVLTFITGFLVIMIYVVFLLIDYDNIAARWRDYLPPSMRDDVSGFVVEFIQATNRYFRSQTLVSCCVAVLFALGFSIIGLPLAILMGIFIGLLNMVPYLQTVGTIPCLLLAGLKALEQGDSFIGALGFVLLVFGVVQLIQETVLVPRLQGEAMGLSPAIILLSLSVWGKLLGFLGLILALPLTCLGLTYYRRYLWKLEQAGELPEIKE
ncbi:MAG: AI-2E family transporter [Proteobacteria bacterium]|jgi:predicted PurR-regulated permease PerM|nr:AI-2E family transporter [Pseudomonadota bacterium]MBT4067917.1 AI-2E family transporter [Candidatus Neomarinimicrobiota bacterium]